MWTVTEHRDAIHVLHDIMRSFLVLPGLVACSVFAWGEVKNLGVCERPFEANLNPGSRLSMHLRSGDIAITGSNVPKLVVTCEVTRSRRDQEVEVKFMSSGKSADLKVSGGPIDDFRLHIQVPAQTHLLVRTTAGELTIDNVTGDKDASLMAGDLTIGVGTVTDYSYAEASVHIGDLQAGPWSVSKDGFFRSFRRTNPGGKYYLNAHVGVGDVTLR